MFTMYKGFTIEQIADCNSVIRYHVQFRGFNPTGYATLNNAHGAITKAIKANPSMPWATPANAESREAVKANLKSIDLNPESYVPFNMDNLVAMLRYQGLLRADGKPKNSDKRSRNKREGGYAGKRAEYRVGAAYETIQRMPVKHWRSGPKGTYDSLKSYAKFLRSIGL